MVSLTRSRNSRIWSCVLLLLVITLACQSQPTRLPSQESNSLPPTPTRAQPTFTVNVPFTTLSPAELAPSLLFSPPAGGESCHHFDETLQYPGVIAFREHELSYLQDSLVICIYSVDAGDDLVVELYDSDGQIITKAELFVMQNTSSGPDLLVYQPGISGLNLPVGSSDLELVGTGSSSERYIGIDVDWPMGLPDEGMIRVVSDKLDILTEFSNPNAQLRPRMSVLDANLSNPFSRNPFVHWGCNFYRAGERVGVIGNGFDPNSEIPIVFYYYDSSVYPPTSFYFGTTLLVDETGELGGVYEITQSDPKGIYFIVAVLNPEVDWAFEDPGPIGCFRVY
jgi:hypothetical protein